MLEAWQSEAFSGGGSYLDMESCLAVRGLCVSGDRILASPVLWAGSLLIHHLRWQCEAPAVYAGLQKYFTAGAFAHNNSPADHAIYNLASVDGNLSDREAKVILP